MLTQAMDRSSAHWNDGRQVRNDVLHPGRILTRVRRDRHAVFAVLLASVCLAGCDEDWHAATHPVSGKVTVNGAAASGAVVTLYPLGEKIDVRNSRPWAITAPNGSFQLQTYEAGDGAPTGDYDITVTWPLDVKKMELAMVDQLDGQFSRPEKSLWTAHVHEGDNELPPIDITGVKLKTKAESARRRALPHGPGMER